MPMVRSASCPASEVMNVRYDFASALSEIARAVWSGERSA